MRVAVLRSLAASLLLGLTTATLSSGVALTPASAAGDAVAPMRLMSFNIRAGVSQADFSDAIGEAKPMADVIGLQEIGQTDKHRYLLTDADWGYFKPSQLQQNPVIWNRRLYDFVSGAGVKIADGRSIGTEYGGSQSVTRPDSFATVVRLQVRSTGQQVSIVNVHLIHGAVKGGLPAPDRPKLFSLLADQVRGTRVLVQAERAGYGNDAVYVMGDLNVGYKQDSQKRHRKLPYRRFGGIGLSSMWKDSPALGERYGTYSQSLLDQIWADQAPRSTEVVRSITQSDHYPAVGVYDPPPADPGYVAPTGSVGFAGGSITSPEGWRNGKAPFLDFDLTGDLRYGYARVELDREASTATEGVDFTFDASGWQDESDPRKRISLRVLNDDVTEGAESVVLRLSDPVNSAIVPRQSVTAWIDANRN